MPVTYRILQAIDLVCVKHSGVIDLNQLVAALQKYTSDPAFRPTQRQLVDIRHLEGAIAGFWEMDEFRKIFGQFYDQRTTPVSVALVTDSEFGERLAWMYGRVMKDETIVKLDVFKSIESALDHLSINKEEFDRLMEKESEAAVVRLFPDRA